MARTNVKPVALAGPVPHLNSDAQAQELSKPFSTDYSPFVTEGYVSLLGSDVQVPVKILRDTGVSESFVLESVLPFSLETDTAISVLIQGIGLNTLSVPLHKERHFRFPQNMPCLSADWEA